MIRPIGRENGTMLSLTTYTEVHEAYAAIKDAAHNGRKHLGHADDAEAAKEGRERDPGLWTAADVLAGLLDRWEPCDYCAATGGVDLPHGEVKECSHCDGEGFPYRRLALTPEVIAARAQQT